ncbi:MAG TPA: hypothetical protein VE843_18650, partial [Ktedonobacteraceae bacterium]|nr:hypothetical protein [Ktedonobacteraceae bacterium]
DDSIIGPFSQARSKFAWAAMKVDKESYVVACSLEEMKSTAQKPRQPSGEDEPAHSGSPIRIVPMGLAVNRKVKQRCL